MTTEAKQVRILRAITLAAVIFFGMVTILILVYEHYVVKFDMTMFEHSITVAKTQSTRIQTIRDMIPNFDQIVHGMWQMVQGEIAILEGITSIATIWLLIIYIWMRRSS